MDPHVLGLGAALAVTGVAVLGRVNATGKDSPFDAPAAPGAETVVIIRDPADLEEHVPAWDELAADAIEVNPFYESWMLRPAVEAFGRGRRLEFALVYRPHEPPRKGRCLIGFFPLERRRFYKGLPVSALRLWKHGHCFVCTPLLHARYARDALAAFLEWAARDRRGAAMIEFCHVPIDGPFHQHLVDYLNRRQRLHDVPETFNRALLRTRASTETFLGEAISGGYRREIRRLRKRLAEAGTVEFRTLAREDEFESWVRQFIDLEARGWKGRAGTGTAIALHENESRYCREVWGAALRRGRLQMAGLYFDGRPIAITVNHLAGDAGFHCKISYDETFARYSPGVQLELELIREAHARRLTWLDSCAVPDHPMINRLWPERRTMQTLLLSTGRWRGDLSVSVLPLLRWLKRMLTAPTGAPS